MRNLLAIFAGIGLVLAALAGVALALVLGVIAAGALAVARLTGLTGRLRPAMARASTAQPHDRTKGEYRVWNDGRGTIIDM